MAGKPNDPGRIAPRPPRLPQHAHPAPPPRPLPASGRYLHLNEVNAFALALCHDEGGPFDRHAMAAALLEDIHFLLTQPDVTLVHWAQFMDSGIDYLGLVSTHGYRKAGYHAYKIYAGMPIDRCPVAIEGADGVGAMASTDGQKASCVIWNSRAEDREITVALDGIRFPHGDFRVYRIDSGCSSWGDDPANEECAVVESRPDVSTSGLDWTGLIPGGGVVYLEADAGNGGTELSRRPVARWLRSLHYFPDRTTTAYVHFDRIRWIAWLGTAREDLSHSQVGVTAEDFPDALSIHVEVDGQLRKLDENSLLGLRLDFVVNDAYAHGILFHGPFDGGEDLYEPARSAPMPWGTERQADEVIAVPNLAEFRVAVADLAPTDWSGQAQLSVILQNAGSGNRVKVTIDRA
ncbi:MAG: xylan 1,4-beta-xylosidase [Thermomicrobiales bacterium]|jgi:hypothetical protein|nr:xylan 1,4-beta-xylosidase [Thermomicrobiales bacterium]